MPLKLIPPGKRGRRFYYVRGTINGIRYDRSTETADRKEAEKRKNELETAILEAESAGDAVTFAIAAQAYIDFRSPSERDEQWIERICNHIGAMFVDEVTPNDLVGVANTIYGRDGSPASKNRAVIRPAAAVLHYAAKNKWCEWMRTSPFKEPEPKTRFVGPDVEQKLHAGLREKGTRHRVQKRLLLLWLFRQGDRIGDTLATKYEDLDLSSMTIHRYIAKTDRTIILPLDEAIARYLRRHPEKRGRIFIWKTRYGAERWILRLTQKLNVQFTPHMARHTVGKRLSENGASFRIIMDKLGHKDSKSSLRYQRGDVESIRAASRSLKIGAKNGADR